MKRREFTKSLIAGTAGASILGTGVASAASRERTISISEKNGVEVYYSIGINTPFDYNPNGPIKRFTETGDVVKYGYTTQWRCNGTVNDELDEYDFTGRIARIRLRHDDTSGVAAVNIGLTEDDDRNQSKGIYNLDISSGGDSDRAYARVYTQGPTGSEAANTESLDDADSGYPAYIYSDLTGNGSNSDTDVFDAEDQITDVYVGGLDDDAGKVQISTVYDRY
jgi:hypothetical protein